MCGPISAAKHSCEQHGSCFKEILWEYNHTLHSIYHYLFSIIVLTEINGTRINPRTKI